MLQLANTQQGRWPGYPFRTPPPGAELNPDHPFAFYLNHGAFVFNTPQIRFWDRRAAQTATLANAPAFGYESLDPSIELNTGSNSHLTFGRDIASTSDFFFIAKLRMTAAGRVLTRGQDGAGSGWSLVVTNAILATVLGGFQTDLTFANALGTTDWCVLAVAVRHGQHLKAWLDGVPNGTFNTARSGFRNSTVGLSMGITNASGGGTTSLANLKLAWMGMGTAVPSDETVFAMSKSFLSAFRLPMAETFPEYGRAGSVMGRRRVSISYF